MKYTPTIGIECHVQLKTKTKLFAAVSNDAREAAPNTLISHICLGMPGALPVLNEKALELAARAAFALNTKPQPFSKFDRKHYFYPDLPKGYQITQYEQPIILGGFVEVPIGEKIKKVGITRVHLEEDAGKNTHPAGADYSLVDLNRAGTPLLEIVSEPEINSAAEAKAYARELWLLMKYADVTDGDLYHGHVRFDVNISVSKEPGKLGTRSEIKNLNSFRSVEGAVAFEIERQIELLEKGQAVVQETRGWDEAKQKTIGQRGKEEAQDYRYMPEPDIPPIELSESDITKFQKELPKLPNHHRGDLKRIGLGPAEMEVLIEVDTASNGNGYLAVLHELNDNPEAARFAANWMINRHFVKMKENLVKEGFALGPIKDNFPTARQIIDVYNLRESNQISSNGADALMFALSLGGKYHHYNWKPDYVAERLKEAAEKEGYLQTSDEGEIEEIVKQVIIENLQAADDVKNGEAKAIGFLVGQVMGKSKGKANPQIAQQIIKKQLGI